MDPSSKNYYFYGIMVVVVVLLGDYAVAAQLAPSVWLEYEEVEKAVDWVEKHPYHGRLVLLMILSSSLLLVKGDLTKPIKRKERPFKFIQLVMAIFMIGGVGYLFLVSHVFAIKLTRYLYPTSLGLLLILLVYVKVRMRADPYRRDEKSAKQNQNSIHLETDTFWPGQKRYINVPNPFRGTLIQGGAGSGKTASIGNAFLHQFMRKKFSGIIYSYKEFSLVSEIEAARQAYCPDREHYIVNFFDNQRTHRCNPLRADLMPSIDYAKDYSMAIINNLDTSTIKDRDFFVRSSIDLLTSVIWFYKVKAPNFCTLPHVLATVLYPDSGHMLSMLENVPESADRIRGIITGLKAGANKQFAGQVSTLQGMLATVNTPNAAWVLTGDDFSLDVNNPKNPCIVSFAIMPVLSDSQAPLISCMMMVAAKLMNQSHKHPSFIFIDEGPTLYIPKLEVIPATGRENKVALVYMAQDRAQIEDQYGLAKAKVITSNLSNKFIGRVNNNETAKEIAEQIGKYEKQIYSKSYGRSASTGKNSLSKNMNISVQERYHVRPDHVTNLNKGEFIGQTVDASIPYFFTHFKMAKVPGKKPIPAFTEFVNELGESDKDHEKVIIQKNFERIRLEAKTVIQRFPNVYGGKNSSAA